MLDETPRPRPESTQATGASDDRIEWRAHPAIDVAQPAVLLSQAAALLLGVDVSLGPMTQILGLHCPGEFLLDAFVHNHEVVFRRNEFTALAQVRDPKYLVTLFWSDTHIEVAVTDRFGSRGQLVRTAPCYLPTKVVDWIEKKGQSEPIAPYRTAADVMREIINQLIVIEGNLAGGAWNSFWDGAKPKREDLVCQSLYPALRGPLQIAKGIRVFPQAIEANGKVDFLFVARLVDGSEVRICAEFKNAHSDDLEHGLRTQLPAYMRSEGTPHGLYVVLDYGPKSPPVTFKPQKAKRGIGDERGQGLWGIYALASDLKIRGHILRLHGEAPPSKRGKKKAEANDPRSPDGPKVVTWSCDRCAQVFGGADPTTLPAHEPLCGYAAGDPTVSKFL